MSVKQIDLPEIGSVSFYKRRGARSVRISLAPNGTLRVSMPVWASYKVAMQFVESKKAWILDQQAKNQGILVHGQKVGKAHRLVFIPSVKREKPTSRIKQNQVQIIYPIGQNTSNQDLQGLAHKTCIKAIKKESEQLLPIRLKELAGRYGFEFGEVSTRHLKSRWGSCDHNRDITLNIFLMQLPWHLIDYVILHELTHTKVMRHGPPFWQELEKHLPNARQLRKEIAGFSTNFNTQN